ncbi:hypothetical protein C8R46DRAFT_1007092 [Mycena filopes]|nr:hypothetical protein C8R46DRAFT_1007092 [Mycena filopes]
MAANQVPDELISEILSPLLKHSDEVFSERSEKALLQPGYSCSTYLMVCKSWLRVSTPLLYNVVILRTTAQAAALEKVLKESPEIGVFIKKLRVEGGFGNAMHTILARNPNITDLFLSAFIYGTDSVKGLCSGLPLIDPQRVILFVAATEYEKPMKNKQVTQLLDTLCLAVAKWNNLRIFDFPYRARLTSAAFSAAPVGTGYEANPRAEALASALEKSKGLEVFLMNLGAGMPDYLRRVAKAPALKTIRLTGWKDNLDRARAEMHKFNDPKLAALVQWDLFEPSPSPPRQSRSPSPLLPEKVKLAQLSDLESLSQTPGAATLREITVDLYIFGPYNPTVLRKPAVPPVNPEILKPFVALTKLHWTARGDHLKLCFSNPPQNFTALENLQKLNVCGHRSPSLLDIGIKLPLTSLQDVDLGEIGNIEDSVAFLKVHGTKLVRLRALTEVLVKIKVFDFCISLRTLVVNVPPSYSVPKPLHIPDNFISASTPHINLAKIAFEGDKDLASEMKRNFTQFQTESFPALKEIQLQCLKWPTSEQQVRKNKWLPLAELLRSKNVTLMDQDGVEGRPRSIPQ